MSKTCAKCVKTVYPIEELKCLDKIWHKACFKCQVCNMTLNMKNYKGYDKKPYCNAHYPTTKFTAVADTPEMARLAQNTKNQSNIKYHEDFEKNIKGTKIQVSDDPETQRVMEHSKLVSQVEYKGLRQQNAEMDEKRASIPTENEPAQLSRRQQGGSVTDYNAGAGDNTASPYSSKFKAGQSTMYTSQGQTEQTSHSRRIGSIDDYDPMNERWGSAASGAHAQYTGGPTSGNQWEERVQLPRQHQAPAQQYHPPAAAATQPEQPPSPRSPGKVPLGGVAMVPVNQLLSLQVHRPQQQRQQDTNQQPQYYPAPAQPQSPPAQQPQRQPSYTQPPPQQQQQPVFRAPAPVQQPPAPVTKVVRYQAMYDYEAQDDDEISFQDGDTIINVEPIDEGWMFGTVQRTGAHGMLPANYVERVA